MNNETASEYLLEVEETEITNTLAEWRKKKPIIGATQYWKVIPKNLLLKEWQYNADTGLVHDEIINKIEEIVVKNYVKLYINTVLFGHTPISPYEYLEIYFSEDYTEEDIESLLEGFEWFAIDNNGNWRISDYGLDEIGSLVMCLLREDDYNKKMYLIDRALNVVHQRSDLSSWFIEGGKNTLNKMARS